MSLVNALVLLLIVTFVLALSLELMLPRHRLVIVAIVVPVRKPSSRSKLRPFWRSFMGQRASQHYQGPQPGKGPESYSGILLGNVEHAVPVGGMLTQAATVVTRARATHVRAKIFAEQKGDLGWYIPATAKANTRSPEAEFEERLFP